MSIKKPRVSTKKIAYLFAELYSLCSLPLGSLLLGILDALLLALVEARQVFMSSSVVKVDFFNRRVRLSLLRRRVCNGFNKRYMNVYFFVVQRRAYLDLPLQPQHTFLWSAVAQLRRLRDHPLPFRLLDLQRCRLVSSLNSLAASAV